MDDRLKLIIFMAVSIAITWLSRRSLRNIRSHVFYRFFAWELNLAIVMLNLNVWFYEPFSWHQLISWLLLLISLYLIIHAVMIFRRSGGPATRQGDPALIGIEKTTQLVTVGPYRYIRHPFYSPNPFAFHPFRDQCPCTEAKHCLYSFR